MSVFGNDLFSQFNESEDEMDHSSDAEQLDQYRKENEHLRSENARLRKALRIITQPHKVKVRNPARDGPAAQLLIYNNVLSRHDKNLLEDHLLRTIYRPKPHDDVTILPQHSALQCPSPAQSHHRRGKDSAYVITSSVQLYSPNFCIDQLGELLTRNNEMFANTPKYERACPDALDGEVIKEEEKEARVMRTCFNCGGKDHQLKDCPTPKNYKAINERKQKFLSMMSNSPQSGTQRYHADQEDDVSDPRFAKFKPGVISSALREALGISKDELPPYIYRMRLLGYPPGHLEEARVKGSGLSFYKGKDSKRSREPDEEEGAVDVDKIIDYPGFNVPAGPRVIDNYEQLGMLPMDERSSKEVMISYHKHKNALMSKRKAETNEIEERTRKRHKPDRTVKPKVDDVREVDMETSDAEGEENGAIVIERNDLTDDGEVVRVDDDDDVNRGRSDEKGSDCDIIISDTEQEYTIEEIIEEGEITSSSCDELTEEPAIDDGYDVEELEEEALKVRREAILKELQLAGSDDSSDVIYVSSAVDLTSEDAKENARNINDVIEVSDEDCDESANTAQSDDVADANTAQSDDVTDANTTQSDDVTDANTAQSDDVTDANTAQSDDVTNANTTQPDDVASANPAQSDDVASANPVQSDDVTDANPVQSDDLTDANPAQFDDVTDANTAQSDDVTDANPVQSDDVASANPAQSDDVAVANPAQSDDVASANPAQCDDVAKNTSSHSVKASSLSQNVDSAVSASNFEILFVSPTNGQGSSKDAHCSILGNPPAANPPRNVECVIEDDVTSNCGREDISHSVVMETADNSFATNMGKPLDIVDRPKFVIGDDVASSLIDGELDGARTYFLPNNRCESPPLKVKDDSPESPSDDTQSRLEASCALANSPSGTPCGESPLPSLPHRSRFAEGITQFDSYFPETKSSGVYKKLKNVLKNSPKNRLKSP